MLFAFLSNHIIYKSLQNLFSNKKIKKSHKRFRQLFESTRDTLDPIARYPTAEDVPRRTTNLPRKNKSHLSETYSRKRRSVANFGRERNALVRVDDTPFLLPFFPCRRREDGSYKS